MCYGGFMSTDAPPSASEPDLGPEWRSAWLAAADAEDGWAAVDAGSAWLDDLVEPTVEQLWEAAQAFGLDSHDASALSVHFPEESGESGGSGDLRLPTGKTPPRLAKWVRREWWHAPIRAEVRRLMTVPPGPRLVSALTDLGSQQPCPADHRHPSAEVEAADPTPAPGSVPGYPCACQLIVAAAWHAVESWVQVKVAATLVEAAGAEPMVATPPAFARAQTTDPARAELAPMLHLPSPSVQGRLVVARDLHAFPALSRAAASGLMFTSAWRVVLYETANLPLEGRDRVVNRVVDSVLSRHDEDRRPWTPGETRKAVKRAIAVVAAAEAAEARDRAYANRRVTVTPAGDGMAWISAYVRDVDAHRIYNRLTSAAAAARADDPDDQRNADERRADALVAQLLGRPGSVPPAANPAAPTPEPTPSPEISVVVSLATLLGLADELAEVPGLGPIDAATARELAADGRWRLWVTDPATGRVVATGSRTYAPSAELARLIRARESHCRMPGCARRAEHCDLDHTVPYPRGSTSERNLGPLCRTHHNLKTHHGYQLANHAAAGQQGWTWTCPSGLTHTDQPDPPLPGP